MMKRFMSATAAFLLAITMMVASTGSLVWVSAENNTHTVTFNTQGVLKLSPQTVPHGGIMTRPPNMPNPAYVAEDGLLYFREFDGWYLSSGTGWIEWNFDTPITSDIEIHALYGTVEGNRDIYRVEFDTNGAGDIPRQDFPDNATDFEYYKVKKPTDPVKEGFIFDGWYNKYWLNSYEYKFVPWDFDSSYCFDVTYEPKTVYHEETNAYYMTIVKGRTLYAQWLPDPNYTSPTTTTAVTTIPTTITTTNNGLERCYHCTAYFFDDETMTVGEVYEGNLIEDMLEYVKEYDRTINHYAVVLKNGAEVTSGLLEQGMKVRIYHGDTLYGEYTIAELLTPYPFPTATTTVTSAQTTTATVKTTTTAKANSNAPKTGYASRLGLYASLFGVSAVVMLAVGMKKKTNHIEE